MNHRTLIAVQFAIWAFAFSRIIPFSGEFLVPIVFILDKKVLFALGIAEALMVVRTLPGALGIVEGVPGIEKAPSFILSLWFQIPVQVAAIVFGLFWSKAFGAWWLRRVLRKKRPDILQQL